MHILSITTTDGCNFRRVSSRKVAYLLYTVLSNILTHASTWWVCLILQGAPVQLQSLHLGVG